MPAPSQPAPDGTPQTVDADPAGGFLAAPLPFRLWNGAALVLALVLPVLLAGVAERAAWHAVPVTLVVVVALSVLNVEIGRRLAGGLSHTHQPHKALSAWSFATGLLLPPPALLLVVPLTYAHARWRGLRIPLHKWVASGAHLVLAGLAAGLTGHALIGDTANWMDGNGGRAILAMLAAGLVFLLVEAVLFAGSAWLGRPEDEVWLRATLRSPGFYGTEAAVLSIGGLFSAVWTGGAWYVLLVVPLYFLLQRAALLEPLRLRAEAATELAVKNAELQDAHQFKADLLGMLGHEIGNPLTAVAGHAEIGQDAVEAGDLDQAGRSLALVERGASRIRAVLGDILAMVASEHGSLRATPEVVELRPHLEAAITAYAGSGTQLDCPAGLTARVQPSHLDQILVNLVSNATKYAGGARCVRAGTDGELAWVEVIDDGAGIPEQFRDQLFQRFSREAGQSSQAGTGLGLFITRELARANGGDIAYAPGVPAGSVFRLSLPRGLPAASTAPPVDDVAG